MTKALIVVAVLSLITLLSDTSTPLRRTVPPTLPEKDFQKHADDLKAKLKDRGFTVLIETPFIVIGDEPEAVVKRRSEDTVKWAVDKLKQDYFTKDPVDILEISLFKDD